MKKISMLVVMLFAIATMGFAQDANKVEVEKAKDVVTTITDAGNEMLADAVADVLPEVKSAVKTGTTASVKFVKESSASAVKSMTSDEVEKPKAKVKAKVKITNKVETTDVETTETGIDDVTVEQATGNVDKYIDRFEKYGTGLKEMVVDIFNYAKDPAKELFNLFVWKVRIYGLVDLGLMLSFIFLTILFGRWMWKGITLMSKRAIQKKKTTFHILLGSIINASLGVVFFFMALSYINDSKQIIMDSVVPEYQAIKDVAVVFGTATNSEKTKEVAEAMKK